MDYCRAGCIETLIKAPSRAKAIKKMRRIQLRAFHLLQSDPESQLTPDDAKGYFWAEIGAEPTLSPWQRHRTRSGGYGC